MEYKAEDPLAGLGGIVSSSVFDGDGDCLGTIQELVLNLKTGRVAYVLVDTGSERVSLPWRALRFNKHRSRFELRRPPKASERESNKFIFEASSAVH